MMRSAHLGNDRLSLAPLTELQALAIEGSCCLSHLHPSTDRGEPMCGSSSLSLYASRFGGVGGADIGAEGLGARGLLTHSVLGSFCCCKACALAEGF